MVDVKIVVFIEFKLKSKKKVASFVTCLYLSNALNLLDQKI